MHEFEVCDINPQSRKLAKSMSPENVALDGIPIQPLTGLRSHGYASCSSQKQQLVKFPHPADTQVTSLRACEHWPLY